MIAALPMYDPPALRPANDRLWNLVREALGTGPGHLNRDLDIWSIWKSPDLLLSQTCGLPYRRRLHGRVTLVAAPNHDLPNTDPGMYCSILICRADDPRSLGELGTGNLAANGSLSQSGWSAPLHHLQTLGLCPRQVSYTGAHVESARAVAGGQADMAGIDAVTWAILRDTEPTLTDRLRMIGRTESTPALPYITAADIDPRPLFSALSAAITALDATDRGALRLSGIVEMPAERYLAVPDPRNWVETSGIPD